MKKAILLSILLSSFSGLIVAQGIYIRAGSGYGLPVASSIIGENYTYSFIINDQITDEETSSGEAVSASYGAGANLSFAIGYKFNENLILDLNILYLVGRKFESSYYNYEDDFDYIIYEKNTYTSYSRGLFFNPGVIFSAGFGNLAPYSKIGIIVGSPRVKEDNNYYTYDDGATSETDINWEYGSGLAIGFQTAVGINWEINEKLDIFSEINFVSMSYYAKEGNIEEYTQDGSNILDQLPYYDSHTVYRKEIDLLTTYNPDNPRIMTRESRAFSSISAQLGIRLAIWARKDNLSGY